MFDYKDFFESFNLDSLVEEAVLRLYYEVENAVTSPLVRPITVNPQTASNETNVPVVEEEVFQEASTTLNSSESKDDNDDFTSEAILDHATVTPPVNPTTNGASTSNVGNDLVSAKNLTTQTGVQVPDYPESRIHRIHPIEKIIGDPGSSVITRGQLKNANSP